MGMLVTVLYTLRKGPADVIPIPQARERDLLLFVFSKKQPMLVAAGTAQHDRYLFSAASLA